VGGRGRVCGWKGEGVWVEGGGCVGGRREECGWKSGGMWVEGEGVWVEGCVGGRVCGWKERGYVGGKVEVYGWKERGCVGEKLEICGCKVGGMWVEGGGCVGGRSVCVW